MTKSKMMQRDIRLGSDAEGSVLWCVKRLSACQRHLWDVGPCSWHNCSEDGEG